MGLAERIAAQTPAGRERHLDALRVIAVLLVVVGHWMVRVVIAPEGVPEARYLLAEAPGWQVASLLFQVMPLFFLLGGVVNAGSWRRARAAGQPPVAWIRGRARRLLRPAVPLLLIVVPAGAALETLAPGHVVLEPAVALIPLWFLAAYLAVTALTPWSVAVHERGYSLWLLAGAAVLALGVDGLRLAGVGPVVGTQPLVGVPNFLLIWGAVHQLGHVWADGGLPRRPAGQLGLAAAGAGALILLIGVAGWPLSMVPIAGTLAPNNAAPPTLALLALAVVQAGLALAASGPLARLLARPRVWAPVALLGGRLMTLFLWHQLAMVLVANLAGPLGFPPLAEALDASWWALRPVWLLSAAGVLVLLVLIMGRFERAAPAQVSGKRAAGGAATLAGVGLVAAGMAGLLWVPLAPVPPATALLALGVVLAGFLALGVIGPRAAGRGAP